MVSVSLHSYIDELLDKLAGNAIAGIDSKYSTRSEIVSVALLEYFADIKIPVNNELIEAASKYILLLSDKSRKYYKL